LGQFNNATTERINLVLLQDVVLSQKTVYRERYFLLAAYPMLLHG